MHGAMCGQYSIHPYIYTTIMYSANIYNILCIIYYVLLYYPIPSPDAAIAHAMSLDGSSGGVIRLVVIDHAGVQKEVIYGNNLPPTDAM